MRTLFVTVDPAFPPISGADLRSWQNALAASELGPVLLLSLGQSGPHSPPSGIAIEYIAGMDPSHIWGSDFDVRFPARAIEQFRSICARFQPDVIVLESLPLANLSVVARECSQAVIIDLHNVESDLVAQDAQLEPRIEIRRALEMRASRIAALEQRAGVLTNMLWVCSSIDRQRLVCMGVDEKRICVIPNGIPHSGSKAVWRPCKEKSGPLTLLFIGHLHYPPNIEAALLLVDLMPAVRERIPDAKLILAGRNPHPAISGRSHPGKIDVVANPISTAPILSAAHLAIMPLRRGGGTRIKALEAIAWGLPVVATARAVEGLYLEDRVHVRIAESASTFVSAICDLSESSARYESQRVAAIHHVMAKFGPGIIRDEVHAALRLLG
jgi:glycosyltransferase involved in cell wall biosynthesis